MKRRLSGAKTENNYDSADEDLSHSCALTTIPKQSQSSNTENPISDAENGSKLDKTAFCEKTNEGLALMANGKYQGCEILQATSELLKTNPEVLEIPCSNEVINSQNERDELPHRGSEKSINVTISAKSVKTNDEPSCAEKPSECENTSLLLDLPKTEQGDEFVKSNSEVTENLQEDVNAEGGMSIPLVVLCQPDNTCKLLDNDLMQECIDSPRPMSGKSPNNKDKTHEDTFVFDNIPGTVYIPDSGSKLQTKTKCMIVLFAFLAIAIVLIVGFLIP